jgi:hypothetical protein
MLFSGKRTGHLRSARITTIVRDIVEVVAIVAAGIWAFYVFAYENRIKPSMAEPNVNVAASMQKLSERNGLIAIGLRVELRNVGTVHAHFTGIAINVYGQRVWAGSPEVRRRHNGLEYNFAGFYHAGPPVPVYSYAYVTRLGNPSTGEDTGLDPGSTLENYRTFYVPQGRFDLLTVGIDAPYTKFTDKTIPTHLSITQAGDAKVVTLLTPEMQQFDIEPVTSLDVR